MTDVVAMNNTHPEEPTSTKNTTGYADQVGNLAGRQETVAPSTQPQIEYTVSELIQFIKQQAREIEQLRADFDQATTQISSNTKQSASQPISPCALRQRIHFAQGTLGIKKTPLSQCLGEPERGLPVRWSSLESFLLKFTSGDRPMDTKERTAWFLTETKSTFQAMLEKLHNSMDLKADSLEIHQSHIRAFQGQLDGWPTYLPLTGDRVPCLDVEEGLGNEVYVHANNSVKMEAFHGTVW